jgi:hypothetical protein
MVRAAKLHIGVFVIEAFGARFSKFVRNAVRLSAAAYAAAFTRHNFYEVIRRLFTFGFGFFNFLKKAIHIGQTVGDGNLNLNIAYVYCGFFNAF